MHEDQRKAGTGAGMDGGAAARVGATHSVIQFGDVRVDIAAHRLLRSGKERMIEPKAYAVLLHLLSRPGDSWRRMNCSTWCGVTGRSRPAC